MCVQPVKEANNIHSLKILKEKDLKLFLVEDVEDILRWNMLVIFVFQFVFYSVIPYFCLLSHKCLKWRLSEPTVTYGMQIRRTLNKYSPPSTLLFIFNNVCVDFWVTHHILSFFLPRTIAGAYTLAHARGRCSFNEENKMKPDTLVVSRDWMGRVKKMWASPRVVKISV